MANKSGTKRRRVPKEIWTPQEKMLLAKKKCAGSIKNKGKGGNVPSDNAVNMKSKGNGGKQGEKMIRKADMVSASNEKDANINKLPTCPKTLFNKKTPSKSIPSMGNQNNRSPAKTPATVAGPSSTSTPLKNKTANTSPSKAIREHGNPRVNVCGPSLSSTPVKKKPANPSLSKGIQELRHPASIRGAFPSPSVPRTPSKGKTMTVNPSPTKGIRGESSRFSPYRRFANQSPTYSPSKRGWMNGSPTQGIQGGKNLASPFGRYHATSPRVSDWDQRSPFAMNGSSGRPMDGTDYYRRALFASPTSSPVARTEPRQILVSPMRVHRRNRQPVRSQRVLTEQEKFVILFSLQYEIELIKEIVLSIQRDIKYQATNQSSKELLPKFPLTNVDAFDNLEVKLSNSAEMRVALKNFLAFTGGRNWSDSVLQMMKSIFTAELRKNGLILRGRLDQRGRRILSKTHVLEAIKGAVRDRWNDVKVDDSQIEMRVGRVLTTSKPDKCEQRAEANVGTPPH